MRSLSSILVGETKEIECFRRCEVETTVTCPIVEPLLRRLMRQVLRRPTPMETVPWVETTWEKVGGTIWVIGTDEGPRVQGAAARSRDATATGSGYGKEYQSPACDVD